MERHPPAAHLLQTRGPLERHMRLCLPATRRELRAPLRVSRFARSLNVQCHNRPRRPLRLRMRSRRPAQNAAHSIDTSACCLSAFSAASRSTPTRCARRCRHTSPASVPLRTVRARRGPLHLRQRSAARSARDECERLNESVDSFRTPTPTLVANAVRNASASA